MATFEEAFPAAIRELDERGLLMNVHLLRLADSDEALSRDVRNALLNEGLAQDRYGVGLAQSADFKTISTQVFSRLEAPYHEPAAPEEVVFASLSDDGWWLMSGGMTTGPFTLEAIGQMRRRGEILKSDLIRQGERGMWQAVDVSTDDQVLPTTPAVGRKSISIFETSPRRTPPKSEEQSVRDSAFPEVTPAASPPMASQAGLLPMETDDSAQYFLWKSGQRSGPISRAELKSQLETGLLNADDFVQSGRDGGWQPVLLALGSRQTPERPSPWKIDLERVTQEIAQRSSTKPTRTGSESSAPASAPPSDSAQKSAAVAGPAAAKQMKPPRPAMTTSPLINGWRLAAQRVGGQNRLRGMIGLLAAILAVLVWWRQPPSAQVLYEQIQTAHGRLESVRRQPGAPEKLAKIASEELPRMRALRVGLKQRASASNPALQELLWACDFGILPLLEHPQGSPENELLYANHMGRALRAIDPDGVDTAVIPAAKAVSVSPP